MLTFLVLAPCSQDKIIHGSFMLWGDNAKYQWCDLVLCQSMPLMKHENNMVRRLCSSECLHGSIAWQQVLLHHAKRIKGEEQEIDSSHRSRTIARNTVAVAVAVAVAIARGLWHSYLTAAASARCGRFET